MVVGLLSKLSNHIPTEGLLAEVGGKSSRLVASNLILERNDSFLTFTCSKEAQERLKLQADVNMSAIHHKRTVLASQLCRARQRLHSTKTRQDLAFLLRLLCVLFFLAFYSL